MVFKSIVGAMSTCLTIASFGVDAILVSRLGGLAYYDTDADLTWIADANYAHTSGYHNDGFMSWADATTWAAGLEVAGITGWRLPTTTAELNAGCLGFNCSGSEMGNLFYNVLGSTAGYSGNSGPFSNFTLDVYWSATEYPLDINNFAWRFNMFSGGFQGNLNKVFGGYAMAVQSGDISAVPVSTGVYKPTIREVEFPCVKLVNDQTDSVYTVKLQANDDLIFHLTLATKLDSQNCNVTYDVISKILSIPMVIVDGDTTGTRYFVEMIANENLEFSVTRLTPQE